ncbi:hypothetical protein [Yersinia phage fHe-Yen9-03]|uniref:Uncharacterized protein n=1 Tax=Yersinia phage fHe-Yen9-03 TaxID=2052743 RepID=A0A2C9D0Q8_9CAUD|nr:hypothetical protein [Yersinia phage fHe-Yen9-03]
MQYKLTEEQSADLLLQLENYIPIIYKINEVAYEFMMKYYKTYISNGQYFFSPMNEKKFFRKMGSGSEIFGVYNDEIPLVRASTNYMGFNTKFLRKHGIIIEPINGELIFEATGCPSIEYSKTVYDVTQLLQFLTEYSNVPFTLGTEELKLYERVKNVNNKRIQTLINVGITYDI